jgi:hypothetical protein
MMAAAVRRHGMTLVTWDVRANGRQGSARLVQRVLMQVRPGSIIALPLERDAAGPGIDTSTVVQALPQILEGLRARNLHVVPLDRLLHIAPYSGRC